MDEDMKLAIKHGAAWLDEKDPEWVAKIQLESLKMEDQGFCILGQTFGDYGAVMDDLAESVDSTDLWAEDHGFDARSPLPFVTTDELNSRYKRLGELWAEYIKERRGEK